MARLPIRGQTKNELIWLTYRMGLCGRGLTGDVIQMSAAEVLQHACAIAAVRNPEKLVVQLEKALARLDLCLGMAAPDWVRREAPTMTELIAERDLQAERSAKARRRSETFRLHLVS